MAKKKAKKVNPEKILSTASLLLGLILITESVLSILLLIEANQFLATGTLIINWLYLSAKTMAGILFLTYGLIKWKK